MTIPKILQLVKQSCANPKSKHFKLWLFTGHSSKEFFNCNY